MGLPIRMQSAIIWSAVGAGGAGIPGAFGAHVDLGALALIWTGLLLRLGYLAGVKLDEGKAAKIAAGVITALGGFVGGVKLANTYFAYTGVGTIPAVVANMGANATLTYLFGRSAAKIFLSNGMHDSVTEIVKVIIFSMIGKHPSGLSDLC